MPKKPYETKAERRARINHDRDLAPAHPIAGTGAFYVYLPESPEDSFNADRFNTDKATGKVTFWLENAIVHVLDPKEVTFQLHTWKWKQNREKALLRSRRKQARLDRRAARRAKELKNPIGSLPAEKKELKT